jgi:hypothetical protein
MSPDLFQSPSQVRTDICADGCIAAHPAIALRPDRSSWHTLIARASTNTASRRGKFPRHSSAPLCLRRQAVNNAVNYLPAPHYNA